MLLGICYQKQRSADVVGDCFNQSLCISDCSLYSTIIPRYESLLSIEETRIIIITFVFNHQLFSILNLYRQRVKHQTVLFVNNYCILNISNTLLLITIILTGHPLFSTMVINQHEQDTLWLSCTLVTMINDLYHKPLSLTTLANHYSIDHFNQPLSPTIIKPSFIANHSHSPVSSWFINHYHQPLSVMIIIHQHHQPVSNIIIPLVLPNISINKY